MRTNFTEERKLRQDASKRLTRITVWRSALLGTMVILSTAISAQHPSLLHPRQRDTLPSSPYGKSPPMRYNIPNARIEPQTHLDGHAALGG